MTQTNEVRVRFAPSPTGYFHVGGARTALYNWLVARKNHGTFVLRIEDTDRERSDESWTEGILNALSWLGISWDEGPFRQSERRPLYDQAVSELVAARKVYACDCTREDIEARRHGDTRTGYDGYCRNRNLEPGPGRALRFRVPDEGTTIVHDVVRGDVEFENDKIEDFVIVKSNGDPLFVLAVVVDDIDMRISHVIRAEEHLPTTPKAVLLWGALTELPLPVFAHLPVLVNEKRQKLSKRRDRVAVEDYRDLGYLPEALRNYLCLLGWAPGDERELLSVDEMIEEFDLAQVNRSPAFFDEKRLNHFNGLYIRALHPDEFIERSLPFVTGEHATWPAHRFDRHVYDTLAPLVQERVTTLGEIPSYVHFVFAEPFEVDEAAYERTIARHETAHEILRECRDAFKSVAFEPETLKSTLAEIGERHGRKLAKAQAPVRVATMGTTVGLPLFESLVVLGRQEVSFRLERAISRISTPA